MHDIKRKFKNEKKKLVGRGGLRGKTSGRGHKGQKARAGNSLRANIRDIIKTIPKLRGHGVNRARTVVNRPDVAVVSLTSLDAAFSSGETVTREAIIDKNLVEVRSGIRQPIKVLGDGEMTKQLTVTGVKVSASARQKIEAAGGKVEG